MNIQKFKGLRNILRSTGIISLIKYPETVRNKKRIKFYEENKPKDASLELNGSKFSMNVDNAYEWSRIHSFYDDKAILSDMSKQAKEDDTFWDVGTSIGLYSIYMSRQMPKGKVISYEPELRSKKRLNENISLNKIENIQVVELALGKEEASFKLALAATAEAGNHKMINANEKVDLQTQTVSVVTGDSLLDSQNLPQPNIIKIDVEGQEENVLLGCKKIIANPACHTIIIEVHFSIFNERNDDAAVDRIVKLLEDNGFNVTWTDPSHIAAYK